MFPTHRQAKLDPILTNLKSIPGVTGVTQDDYDSVSIRVVLSLDDANSRSGSFDGRKPYRLAPALGKQPIRRLKSLVAKAVGNVSFVFSSVPELKYATNGGEKVRDGYDSDYLSVDVYV